MNMLLISVIIISCNNLEHIYEMQQPLFIRNNSKLELACNV